MPSADPPLSRRDWVLLPAVSLLTILFMAGVTETVCRLVWPEMLEDRCASPSGHRPNCVTRIRNAEGQDYEYRFNECGYRTRESCLHKPEASFRLVTMGSSIAMGMYVGQEEMFASRCASELSTLLGKPAESQNFGSLAKPVREIRDQIPSALALRPDAIVMTVGPFDLATISAPVTGAPAKEHQPGILARWTPSVASLRTAIRKTRAGVMAQHWLLRRDSFFFNSYSRFRDPDDALGNPPSAVMEQRYRDFDSVLAQIREKLGQNATPVFILPLPNRIMAGMLADHIQLQGTDPEVFQRRVAASAAKYGMQVVDTSSPFAAMPHAENLFYSVDSHPGPGAHAVLGHALALSIAQYFKSGQGTSRD